MSDPSTRKQRKENYKTKSYQFSSKKRNCLEIGQRGFLATCNYREKDCVRECYNVLSQYADQLYGPDEKALNNKDDDPKEEENGKHEEETDISDDLQKEIDAVQAVSEPGRQRRFQSVDTGTKNCIFIKTTLPDPVELGVKLIKDIAENQLRKARFLLRLIPIEKVCKADVDDIAKTGDAMFDKYFLGEGKTFSVVLNKRYNNDIKRDVVIKTLADKVLEMNPKNKVDLKNPELTIMVEIVKGKCCLSVVEGYMKYKKYNLVELGAGAAKTENGAKKEEDQPEEMDDATDKPEEEEDDSNPEDIVRDVPVGHKLKELLERKRTSDDEPNAKKFKNGLDENADKETVDDE